MLCKELGADPGRDIFIQIIDAFGPGQRIRVPKIIFERPYQSSFYWNPHKGNNPALFLQVRNILFSKLGDSTGAAVFNRMIIDLGPGEKLRVPYYKCSSEICKCTKACLWREHRDKEINSRFNGINHQELSLNYSLTERMIRNIVNG